MKKPPDLLTELTSLVLEAKQDMEATARAELVISLTSLTLMVDKGIITIPETVERIELLRGEWLRDQDRQAATVLVQVVIDRFRAHESQPDHGWTPTVLPGGRQGNPED